MLGQRTEARGGLAGRGGHREPEEQCASKMRVGMAIMTARAARGRGDHGRVEMGSGVRRLEQGNSGAERSKAGARRVPAGSSEESSEEVRDGSREVVMVEQRRRAGRAADAADGVGLAAEARGGRCWLRTADWLEQ